MASESGAAYVIEEVRPSPTRPERLNLLCVRLDYGCLELDAEGVWPIYWGRRR